MSYQLGVDLGTTFTAAAVADGSEPTVIGLGNRALQIPSVLFLKPDGEFLVGEAAERRGLTEPDRLAREFKRRIGDHVPIMVAGAPFSPQALTAHLLRWVVDRASEQMGEPPSEVVLAHPANWGPFRLELLDQVAVLAGLAPASRCTEPEAAAAQYASQNRMVPGDMVAVYDLGGGTFDACVLEKTRAGFRAMGTPEGVEHLGGIDFDEAVLRHVLGTLGSGAAALDPEDPAVTVGLARLRRDCVEAKEALSTDVDTLVPVALPGLVTTVRVTRAEFELMIRPALTGTIAATRRALRNAQVEPSQLRSILLVGGSSRIPLVSEMLHREFSVPTAVDTHPKHDVALGSVRVGKVGADAVTKTTSDERAPTSSSPSVGELSGHPPDLERGVEAGAPSAGSAAVAPPGVVSITAETPARQRVPSSPLIQADSAHQPAGPPAAGTGRLLPWFRLVTLALLLVAVLVAVLGPRATAPVELTFNGDLIAVAPPGWGEQDLLQPELLGSRLWPLSPIPALDRELDLNPYRVWLGGSLRGHVVGEHAGAVLLVPGADWGLSKRLLSAPGAAMLLAGLFSFAYAESLLRVIRRRHAGVRAGEFFGVVVAGALGGVAVVLAAWILSGRFLVTEATVAVVGCWCAAIGLLVFGWESPVDTRRIKSVT